MSLQMTPPSPVLEVPGAPLGPDAGVIREAKRRRRRRRVTVFLIVVAFLGAVVAIVALVSSGSGTGVSAGSGSGTGGLPTGSLASLGLAGPLAVGPTGALYIADVERDRILVRLPDGRFRVVAGTGKAGFSGDGGPAVSAELSGISDLAFAADGTLYVADSGRVRTISPDGVIRTIAGDGRGGVPLTVPVTIANGTPALSAPLGSNPHLAKEGDPLSIALSASGQLYISTGWQILRLTRAGTLDTVRALITSGPLKGRQISGFGPIAVDGHGDIDVAGVNGWSIWRVQRDGTAHDAGYARASGGAYAVLERGPNGSVYGMSGRGVVRVQRRLVPTLVFAQPVHGEYFWPTYFAFGPRRLIYVDELPGDGGFEAHQQLISVRHARISLLWQEHNAGDRDSFGPH
jgi:hypothetical protein